MPIAKSHKHIPRSIYNVSVDNNSSIRLAFNVFGPYWRLQFARLPKKIYIQFPFWRQHYVITFDWAHLNPKNRKYPTNSVRTERRKVKERPRIWGIVYFRAMMSVGRDGPVLLMRIRMMADVGRWRCLGQVRLTFYKKKKQKKTHTHNALIHKVQCFAKKNQIIYTLFVCWRGRTDSCHLKELNNDSPRQALRKTKT